MRSFFDCMTPIFSPADRPLPVVCSGQWGGQAPETYERTGRTLDLMYLGGGGIHGHPAGPRRRRPRHPPGLGRRRGRRRRWKDYARDHPELAASLKKFGATKEPALP